MNNSELEKIAGHCMERWQRKLIKQKGSFYVSIPKPIVTAMGKKYGSIVYFSKVFDERKGRVITTLEFE